MNTEIYKLFKENGIVTKKKEIGIKYIQVMRSLENRKVAEETTIGKQSLALSKLRYFGDLKKDLIILGIHSTGKSFFA